MRREKQSIQREGFELAPWTGTLHLGPGYWTLAFGRGVENPYFGVSTILLVLVSCESLALSRRDPAQPLVLQVGTPSFGKSHCVSSSHATKKTTIQTQSGIFLF